MGKGKQFWGLKRRSTGTLPSIPDGGTWRNGRRSPSKGKETKGEGVTGGEELIEETREDDKHYHFSYSYFYRGFCMAAMVALMEVIITMLLMITRIKIFTLVMMAIICVRGRGENTHTHRGGERE